MLSQIHQALKAGVAVPYLGPGVLALVPQASRPPANPIELVARLTASSNVPHKLRNNLSATAQFIENFKHRKSVVQLMNAAFATPCAPTALHTMLSGLPQLPLIVHAWYDDLCHHALRHRASWGTVQGVSQAEHGGEWTRAYDRNGQLVGEAGTMGNGVAVRGPVPEAAEAAQWSTLLYEPIGSVAPAGNYVVSDSDYVEVMTEIDIQTPIPEQVRNRRVGRNFLFLGCRFNTQIERIMAFEIAKRSSDRHWVVLAETPTQNELRFMQLYNIGRLDMPLDEFVRASQAALAEATLAV